MLDGLTLTELVADNGNKVLDDWGEVIEGTGGLRKLRGDQVVTSLRILPPVIKTRPTT